VCSFSTRCDHGQVESLRGKSLAHTRCRAFHVRVIWNARHHLEFLEIKIGLRS
jgi:hypothetical protein